MAIKKARVVKPVTPKKSSGPRRSVIKTMSSGAYKQRLAVGRRTSTSLVNSRKNRGKIIPANVKRKARLRNQRLRRQAWYRQKQKLAAETRRAELKRLYGTSNTSFRAHNHRAGRFPRSGSVKPKRIRK